MSDGFPAAIEDAPEFFLNSTRVEDGRRFVNSSLRIPLASVSDAIYSSGRDERFVAAPIANSTAAHLSSRFSWVNPHATLYDATGATWGRLVDGGYSEGTGLTTLFEVLDAFWEAARSCGRSCPRISLEIVYIANDPRTDDQLEGTEGPTIESEAKAARVGEAQRCPDGKPSKSPTPFLWEFTSPASAAVHSYFASPDADLRYRIHEHKLGSTDPHHPPVTLHIISLKRMIDSYTSGAFGVPNPRWCRYYANLEARSRMVALRTLAKPDATRARCLCRKREDVA